MNPNPELFLNRHLDQVADLSDRVVSRGDIEDARDLLASLNRPNVPIGGVFDTHDRAPDGRVVDRDLAVAHSVFNMVLTIKSRRIRGL